MIVTLRPLLFFALLLAPAAAAEKCACTFEVSEEEEDGCAVYGQLGDGVLIAWERASQECLDAFNIHQQAIDPDTLVSMCPNADGTDANAFSFLQYLRNSDDALAQGIKASYPKYWVETTEGSGVYTLVDTIQTDSNVLLNCITTTSLCYNEILIYFTARELEVGNICADLYDASINALELEQSMSRIRICQDGADAPEECETLKSQVIESVAANPDKFCSAYGLGPATAALPDTATCSNDGNNNGNTTSGAAALGFTWVSVLWFVANLVI
jgi:hypothetical protein